ncbi:MAG TPA: hypothetical protein VKM55_08040 [Candidatus Lokiarchaeia archaeon]|nr:hypothetical protein [Candidatus Lokiarchaeia archaeon]
MKETTRKCGGDRSTAGNKPADQLGVPLDQPPGVGSVTRKGDVNNQVLPVTWYRLFLHDRRKNVVYPHRYEQWSLRATGTETRTSRNSSIRRPILASTGDAWPPKLQLVASATAGRNPVVR